MEVPRGASPLSRLRRQPVDGRSSLFSRRRRLAGMPAMSSPVIEAGVDSWRLLFKTTHKYGQELTKLAAGQRSGCRRSRSTALTDTQAQPASAPATRSRSPTTRLDACTTPNSEARAPRCQPPRKTATYRFPDGRAGLACLGSPLWSREGLAPLPAVNAALAQLRSDSYAPRGGNGTR
jgi:hypothetical protein